MEKTIVCLEELSKKLESPFHENELSWRARTVMKTTHGVKAILVPYVDARIIMRRLDDVFGVFGWKDEYTPLESGFLCTLSVNINGEWYSKQDGSNNTQVESTKGGISNSFKRAAVKFNIGRYIYELDEIWVDVKTTKQNSNDLYIKQKMGNSEIKGYCTIPRLPEWAIPKRGNNRPTSGTSEKEDNKSKVTQLHSTKPDVVARSEMEVALDCCYNKLHEIGIGNDEKSIMKLYRKLYPDTKIVSLHNAKVNELRTFYQEIRYLGDVVQLQHQLGITVNDISEYCNDHFNLAITKLSDLFLIIPEGLYKKLINWMKLEAPKTA